MVWSGHAFFASYLRHPPLYHRLHTQRGRTSMTTRAGVGMSLNHSPNVAGREAAEQALEKAEVSDRATRLGSRLVGRCTESSDGAHSQA